MNTNPTDVYCLFRTIGDVDDHRTDVLLGVFTSPELAQQHCRTLPYTLLDDSEDDENEDQSVHNTMSIINGYTYVGERSDCCYGLANDCFGGYIIEPIQLNRITNSITPSYNPEHLTPRIDRLYQQIKTECDNYSAKIHEMCRPLMAKQEELYIAYEETTDEYDEEIEKTKLDDPNIKQIREKYNTILDGLQLEIDTLHGKICGYHARIYEMYRHKWLTFKAQYPKIEIPAINEHECKCCTYQPK